MDVARVLVPIINILFLATSALSFHSCYQYDIKYRLRSHIFSQSQVNILPEHIAFIVDGNGRWALSKGLPRTEGHNAGARTTIDIVRACFDSGINAVTLFVFSTENWKRPSNEVENIMNILEFNVKLFSDYFKESNISLKVIGQKHRLSNSVREVLQNIVECTADGNRTLCLALSYGGRDDIVQVNMI